MKVTESTTYVMDVYELPKDMKRILKVQFREFIHFVEDAQDKICYSDFNRDNDKKEAA